MRVRAAIVRAALALALLAACDARAERHVLLVSADGLRPDVALRADMPVLRALMARGSFTMWAVTTDLAVTLPSHVSMLTGVPPPAHGITYNHDTRPGEPAEPAWPTLFELAKRAGLRTAMSAGKGKFSLFAEPGALDRAFVPARGASATDEVVADSAARWLAAVRPNLMFVHLPGLDAAGHANAWGSAAQVAAAAHTDRALGRVLQALARAGMDDSTLVLVSADHGGAGTTHGGLDPRSRTIPWIAAGPGVRRDFDLTTVTSCTVRTEDTFATIAEWLGLTIERPVEGRPVREAFEAATPSRATAAPPDAR